MPAVGGRLEAANCLTLYDWSAEVNRHWLSLFDEVFEELGGVAARAVGSFLDFSASGSYLRVRRRLETFLDEASAAGEFDIRLRSTETHRDTPFFPSEIEIALNGDRIRRNKMCISIRCGSASVRGNVLDPILSKILDMTGPCYGALFDFPAAFGPSFYLSSVAALPEGADWRANQLYTDRITRWRDRTRRDGVSPSEGFLRELYESNLLTDRHLQASVDRRSLAEFADAVGVMRPIDSIPGMYRWDIPQHQLNEARCLLEPTGLVLSA